MAFSSMHLIKPMPLSRNRGRNKIGPTHADPDRSNMSTAPSSSFSQPSTTTRQGFVDTPSSGHEISRLSREFGFFQTAEGPDTVAIPTGGGGNTVDHPSSHRGNNKSLKPKLRQRRSMREGRPTSSKGLRPTQSFAGISSSTPTSSSIQRNIANSFATNPPIPSFSRSHAARSFIPNTQLSRPMTSTSSLSGNGKKTKPNGKRKKPIKITITNSAWNQASNVVPSPRLMMGADSSLSRYPSFSRYSAEFTGNDNNTGGRVSGGRTPSGNNSNVVNDGSDNDEPYVTVVHAPSSHKSQAMHRGNVDSRPEWRSNPGFRRSKTKSRTGIGPRDSPLFYEEFDSPPTFDGNDSSPSTVSTRSVSPPFESPPPYQLSSSSSSSSSSHSSHTSSDFAQPQLNTYSSWPEQRPTKAGQPSYSFTPISTAPPSNTHDLFVRNDGDSTSSSNIKTPSPPLHSKPQKSHLFSHASVSANPADVHDVHEPKGLAESMIQIPEVKTKHKSKIKAKSKQKPNTSYGRRPVSAFSHRGKHRRNSAEHKSSCGHDEDSNGSVKKNVSFHVSTKNAFGDSSNRSTNYGSYQPTGAHTPTSSLSAYTDWFSGNYHFDQVSNRRPVAGGDNNPSFIPRNRRAKSAKYNRPVSRAPNGRPPSRQRAPPEALHLNLGVIEDLFPRRPAGAVKMGIWDTEETSSSLDSSPTHSQAQNILVIREKEILAEEILDSRPSISSAASSSSSLSSPSFQPSMAALSAGPRPDTRKPHFSTDLNSVSNNNSCNSNGNRLTSRNVDSNDDRETEQLTSHLGSTHIAGNTDFGDGHDIDDSQSDSESDSNEYEYDKKRSNLTTSHHWNHPRHHSHHVIGSNAESFSGMYDIGVNRSQTAGDHPHTSSHSLSQASPSSSPSSSQSFPASSLSPASQPHTALDLTRDTAARFQGRETSSCLSGLSKHPNRSRMQLNASKKRVSPLQKHRTTIRLDDSDISSADLSELSDVGSDIDFSSSEEEFEI